MWSISPLSHSSLLERALNAFARIHKFSRVVVPNIMFKREADIRPQLDPESPVILSTRRQLPEGNRRPLEEHCSSFVRRR